MKRFNNNILVTLLVFAVFVVSGAVFLTFLGFGLFGLSRLLIYFHLGSFDYDKSFIDNLIYYGSYIVFGYFIFFAIEHLMDYFRKKLPENDYFNGGTFHLISYVVTTILFYFVIHINYAYIKIDFWVIMLIIGFLYMCKIVFYPDSENLNRNQRNS
ncbi:SepA family multidrug efflux transporter [Staphylococcus lugdunensis]|jgi:ABC-type Na+ efflux pump permease subunit|uniref:Multidrug resistance efflux pump SepA n=2 Tax=Staphylococcus lugdunensis TaxID=28035 RepID=A0A292DKW3_STALU|nr:MULTISPECIES: SepA family multidrug efflux transporter [Staphylococcus]ADC86997.1 SmrB [Staphylococcus lugdunensis HKU09-01]AMG62419.1 multidrug resistance protein SepA [Staphylococcus lugdunensis]AMG63658.1 multidrug resistance protein SepA [Staphylococcus lugdunensis]ARB77273.1 multidrug resistance protein SepA [Staphylococcus lugdunensis]ARJ08729.1 multidrug resistance protein SepA [Staphylococcus lugdunensis]